MVDMTQSPTERGALARLWAEANAIQKIAALIGIALVLLAVFAPLIAPFDPLKQSLISRLRPPVGFDRHKAGFWLGTDELGRDVLSRSLYGLRLTMMLAMLGAVLRCWRRGAEGRRSSGRGDGPPRFVASTLPAWCGSLAN